MRSGARVGKVFGITVRIDWSWFFFYALLVWNLYASFGSIHPAWGAMLRWGMGLAAALLFSISVLIHELAHSLVARARRIPVRSITFFMFGGVSNIQDEPDSPGSEFTMALVGPLVSVAIGAILLVAGGSLAGPLKATMHDPSGLLAKLGPLTTLTLWLGSINIMVGIFNLLPAFPLDGGRILRAILWTITGSLRRATRWAAVVGQTIAWLMIVTGISSMFGLRIPLIVGGFVNGLWLAFLGWFLSNAATLSYRRVIVRDILEGVPVQRLMRSDPPTVSPEIIVRELVDEHIIGRDDQAFPVVSDGALVGMVSIQDIRTVPRDRWQEISVGEIMTPLEKLATVGPDVDSADAFDRLTQRDVRQLPVLDGTGLVGLVRRRDILRWLQIEGGEVYMSGSGA